MDTPNSQVVEVAPKGSETLGSRANVLANLMVDGEVKDAIAERAGLRPKQLVAGSVATGGAEAEEVPEQSSYRLTTGVVLNSDMAELPIIRVEAQAPDTRGAIKLADAAVTGLERLPRHPRREPEDREHPPPPGERPRHRPGPRRQARHRQGRRRRRRDLRLRPGLRHDPDALRDHPRLADRRRARGRARRGSGPREPVRRRRPRPAVRGRLDVDVDETAGLRR